MSKKIFAFLTVLALLAVPAMAQLGLATVKGKCTDDDGKPIVGAIVKLTSPETGLKYELKTDKNGEYRSIAIQPSIYRISLVSNGAELWWFGNKHITLSLDTNDVDFDLKKLHTESGQGNTQAAKVNAEAQKQQDSIKKENASIKAIQSLLDQSRAASEAGNHDQAITLAKQASESGAQYFQVWGRLGDAYLAAAKKDKDQSKWQESTKAYQKAIEISTAPGAPDRAKESLGDFYNNLADSMSQTGQVDEAAKDYEKAASLASAPADAARFYFNLGAMYANKNMTDQSIAAFDKSIAADPKRSESYYQKGISLLNKATTGKDGKVIAAPGTSEAFNTYLELDPNGRFAAQAKQMLDYIGSKIETTYKKKK